MKKILIANRGEIAVRIAKTLKKMGFYVIVTASTIDKKIWKNFEDLVDQVVCIGPASAKDSYQNIAAIISSAKLLEVDAIHPGYGFLSENTYFAKACEKENITFIGPHSKYLKILGDKLDARKLMSEKGIPVIPASGILEDITHAFEETNKMGYPVLLKSVVGGGGKGSYVVKNEDDLKRYFNLAQAESFRANGKKDIYIEKYLENVKHIEIQVLADYKSQIHTLFERDCSVQRKFQKVLEEAPAAALPDDVRKKVIDLGRTTLEGTTYKGLATIEFMVSNKGEIFFLEINPRIQVEHPVTEYITGIDLVEEQMYSIMGEKSKIDFDNLHINGHAIECRINAEDSENKFTPSSGIIVDYKAPDFPFARMDSFLYPGYEVSGFYDSLLGKLIVHGSSRKDAILKMEKALGDTKIEGIPTLLKFHKKFIKNKKFISGDYNTNVLQYMNI